MEGSPVADTYPMVTTVQVKDALATHLVLSTLHDVPQVERLVVMVQREVGERLVAEPGSKAFGLPSLRVAYRAEGAIVRRVPPAVF